MHSRYSHMSFSKVTPTSLSLSISISPITASYRKGQQERTLLKPRPPLSRHQLPHLGGRCSSSRMKGSQTGAP